MVTFGTNWHKCRQTKLPKKEALRLFFLHPNTFSSKRGKVTENGYIRIGWFRKSETEFLKFSGYFGLDVNLNTPNRPMFVSARELVAK